MSSKYELEDFGVIVENNVGQLEKEFLNFVENAYDKQYAKEHFISMHFKNHPDLPIRSYFFNLLLLEFTHQVRIAPNKALQITFENIETLKEVVQQSYRDTGYFCDLSKTLFHESKIPPLMKEHMRIHNIRFIDLYRIDQEIMEENDQFFLEKVTLHFTCMKLRHKYSDDVSIVEEDKKSKFTRNEQILAMFFLLKSFDVNILGQADRNKIAALFHLILGVDFNDTIQIKNLSIYKSLSKLPQVVQSNKQLVSYLQNIRTYFLEANFIKAVELIDREINLCKENSK